ncbi:cyclohexadienyl dehydratase [Francisella halioticida]|uniref:Cyclohexadienyl dehydratase n=1 Tax=Francisella halioticida TaxID=549298 RepID=A0ABN5AXE8_9GAMM|nr:transporter substrate-binding domain-containing protein [Francisella halioticida]ASG68370.1 cyclohexadienyl dehydratase [Francisella halioticida]
MIKITALLSSLFLLVNFAFSTILVGTTGDYAPFSIYQNKEFSGKDIDLIKEFAKTQKQNIEFVKTTWASSSKDLAKGKFDVFVGSVTKTPQREKLFIFSKNLNSFSKAAMTQCENLNKYRILEDIDNSKSLIVANHGGTNETFTLQKVKKANILIVPSNIVAIRSLLSGVNGIYPNIMFTDSTEIAYQHEINPKLCLIPIKIDDNISHMVFLFNKTEKGRLLVKQFNQWLSNNPKILEKYNSY